jgi:hypothetical protein
MPCKPGPPSTNVSLSGCGQVQAQAKLYQKLRGV